MIKAQTYSCIQTSAGDFKIKLYDETTTAQGKFYKTGQARILRWYFISPGYYKVL